MMGWIARPTCSLVVTEDVSPAQPEANTASPDTKTAPYTVHALAPTCSIFADVLTQEADATHVPRLSTLSHVDHRSPNVEGRPPKPFNKQAGADRGLLPDRSKEGGPSDRSAPVETARCLRERNR